LPRWRDLDEPDLICSGRPGRPGEAEVKLLSLFVGPGRDALFFDYGFIAKQECRNAARFYVD
jgi:hypothetical protein